MITFNFNDANNKHNSNKISQKDELQIGFWSL